MEKKEIHPAAKLDRILDETELRELAQSIKQRGLQQPIELYDGMVISGRNRLLACEIAGVKPEFRDVTDIAEDPYTWAYDSNHMRRHDSVAVRVDAAASYAERLRKSNIEYREKTKKEQREEAAQKANTSVRSMEDGEALRAYGCAELREAVLAQDISLRKGAKIARQFRNSAPQQRKALLDAKGVDRNLLTAGKPQKEEEADWLSLKKQEYQKLLKQVDDLKKVFARLCEGKHGAHMVMWEKQIAEAFKAIRTAAVHYAPAEYCPKCDFKGCKFCNETGWITKGIKQRL